MVKTQKQRILDSLLSGKALTVRDVEKRGILGRNLSRRVADLRNEGFVIHTSRRRLSSGPNRGRLVTEYTLESNF